MSEQEKPCAVPIEEQAERLREHYERAATALGEWCNQIPRAVDEWEERRSTPRPEPQSEAGAEHCHWCGKERDEHEGQGHTFERCKCQDDPIDRAHRADPEPIERGPMSAKRKADGWWVTGIDSGQQWGPFRDRAEASRVRAALGRHHNDDPEPTPEGRKSQFELRYERRFDCPDCGNHVHHTPDCETCESRGVVSHDDIVQKYIELSRPDRPTPETRAGEEPLPERLADNIPDETFADWLDWYAKNVCEEIRHEVRLREAAIRLRRLDAQRGEPVRERIIDLAWGATVADGEARSGDCGRALEELWRIFKANPGLQPEHRRRPSSAGGDR